jgi:hypothetical protein
VSGVRCEVEEGRHGMDLADLITLPSGKPYRRARRHQSPPPPNSHLISSLVLLFLIFYLSLTSSSFRLKKNLS